MDDAGLNGLTGGTAAVAASAELAGLAAGGGHGRHGHSGACLNCGATLVPAARFCSQCGQDTANHPPSLFEFVHEFVSHYIAVEGTLWKSLRGLLLRPGFLTREYLAGRKQRYVLPLRLLLTLGLLFFLSLKLMPGGTHTLGLDDDNDVEVAEAVETAASAASAVDTVAGKVATVRKKLGNTTVEMHILHPDLAARLPLSMQERIVRAEAHWRADPKGTAHAMGATMLGLAPYAVLCSLPFFAGLLKLLFWRQPYGAHFVFAMHLHAAWYAMLLLAVMLPWSLVAFVLWIWSNVYPVIALKRVHAASWWTTVMRAGLLAVMHWFILGLGFLVLAMVGALAGS
ncbi:DUF3667 domain-containing protein [Roseateles cellulosilyticus]|uniref:DUF3667 domain-containing protein n=1 Tax=Pelomonas cellulosilytica TaxID=2906762 RepID=A0ABS8XVD4_9BURK|nr:DUF3667 domain-containing protein [Pelomonas sp. P8]MCE4555727.1 DUF3667 domain-containing protein [Pelomonas sp. P8]